MTVLPQELQQHWTAISPLLLLRNEQEYDRAVERLNRLLDEVGSDEQHPLYTLLDTLGTLIHAYEEEHHPIPECNGVDVLRFLMDEHALTQADVPEIGSQGVVSEVLRGKRELNIQQIHALAFDEHSAWQDDTMQVLEEYWVRNALYRQQSRKAGEQQQ